MNVGQLLEADWSPWIKMGWLFTLGGLDSLKQDSEHARECFAEALLWADTAGDSRWRTFILNHLARIEMTLGYWEQARLHLDCALAINRKEQNLGLIVYCMLGKGALAVGTDPPEEARGVLLEGLQLAREAGYVLHVPEFLLNLADVCLRLADLEDALGFADEARQLAVASGMKMQECQALVLLGRIAAAGNDQEGACTYWREGWSLARLVGVDAMVTTLDELLARGQYDERG
ncbi:hypothetical protein LAJ19_20850 (plasmid) [Deinococcus taeanensis]|uniref:hypothetical protein n=1 Tax=Deinococcus taeanensis TaxID=2737050 RepID=UPI001CDD1D86|nr:hypothetical protein [Deinococcus taeanensis]UBV45249.1 hypothetical protein LAJ19_20850 [Deinococcus taeanensis]